MMPRESVQLRVLYREFLFRMLDLDLLPAPADMTKLLGQIAAMLAAFNFLFARGVSRVTDMSGPMDRKLSAAWGDEHFFIATTMLSVGILAVLCWDSTFPDRRDVLVLAPLPVRTRTLFAAKIGSLGTALGLTVLSVNVFTGLSYPLVLGEMVGGLGGMLRWFGAYWITVLAAGGFVLCLVLTVQGLASQVLPRRIYLRFSAGLQLISFVVFLAVFFLQPPLATPGALANPANARLLEWLPSYWFLGLFSQLSGTLSTAPAMMAELSSRAVAALGWVVSGAGLALALSYRRTMRMLVEEPDIVPGEGSGWRLPRWGDSLDMAIVQFGFRSLLRSRQHRLVFALYLGIGLAFALACARRLLYGKGREAWNDTSGPMLVASILLLSCAVVGMRVVLTMPITLQANWVFRITELRSHGQYLKSVRRAFVVMGIVPILLLLSGLFALIWPMRAASVHLVVLGFWSWVLAEYCMVGFYKIPFTCSYLPGKANLHVRSGAFALVLIAITDLFAEWEKVALRDWRQFSWILVVLSLIAVYGRWTRVKRARIEGDALQYEEAPLRDIHALELYRDGRMAMD